MQELSGMSEAARELAMSRFRLIQPHLEENLPLQLVAADARLSFRTAQRWVSQYRKFGRRDVLITLAELKGPASRQTAVELTAKAIAVADGPHPYDLGIAEAFAEHGIALWKSG
jgi:hypothetical protein